MPREAQCKSEGDWCISKSFIVQELGRSPNRTYKAHPFDFNTNIFLSTLQKDPDTCYTSITIYQSMNNKLAPHNLAIMYMNQHKGTTINDLGGPGGNREKKISEALFQEKKI